MVEERAKDRRIQRTRSLLHDALGSLIHEKPYDEIVVREILNRANVGRSTFYAHFSDKDELLASSIHDLLRSVYIKNSTAPEERCERLISFSLPLFEHIHRHRQQRVALIGVSGRAVIHERLQRMLTELIANDLRRDFESRNRWSHIPSDIFVKYIASTFTLVLNWWIESRSPLKPGEINDVFRALVLPTVTAASD
jgi:AcrR family transcriptional regulator